MASYLVHLGHNYVQIRTYMRMHKHIVEIYNHISIK